MMAKASQMVWIFGLANSCKNRTGLGSVLSCIVSSFWLATVTLSDKYSLCPFIYNAPKIDKSYRHGGLAERVGKQRAGSR